MVTKFNNKWIRGALAALLIHCSIGMVYAWSLFVIPISEYINKTPQQVQFAFSLAIFFLGMSAAFGGKFVEKNIKKSSLVSMLFFCSGLILTGGAIYLKSLIGIYISYGMIMGIGLGIGYITPIKSLMLWFSENKGLGTGIAVTGFGLGSTIASPLITLLISRFSLQISFSLLGLIYAVPMIIAHLIIKKPNWYVEKDNSENFSYISMLKNKTFIIIWIMLYINISCGLALISVASPIMKDISLPISSITLVVAIMGIFNGAGRLLFSMASDKLKHRDDIYKVIFCLSMLVAYASFVTYESKCIIVTLFVISMCYGAGFSNLPSLLSDKFGMNDISKIHGLSLTAWAFAGLTGNQISTLIKSRTGSYNLVLELLIVMYIIGFVLTCVVRKRN